MAVFILWWLVLTSQSESWVGAYCLYIYLQSTQAVLIVNYYNNI